MFYVHCPHSTGPKILDEVETFEERCLVVFFVLGFSFTTNEKIYITTYDANGKLMMNAASFEENMNTVCWIRPDYIVRLVLSRMPRYQKMIFD